MRDGCLPGVRFESEALDKHDEIPERNILKMSLPESFEQPATVHFHLKGQENAICSGWTDGVRLSFGSTPGP